MLDLQSYSKYIEEGLTKLNIPETPSSLYDPIRYFLSIGGKRIRPVLTLLGAELFGIEREKVLNQALAIEVFHNFTLVHDDIMDKAPIRRGKETVHKKWNENVAILSGDVMMIQSYQLLMSLEKKDVLPELLRIFNQTAIDVCEGQQLDMDFEVKEQVSISEYIEMIRLKTSVLLGCALQIGAIIGGANKGDQKALFEFGQNIGIAFQIQDDILDAYGGASFGKQTGGDIVANKKTLLYLYALQRATKEQREVFKQLEKEEDLSLKIEKTIALFDALDVRSVCEKEMNYFYEKAISSLGRVSEENSTCLKLKQLAEYLIVREK